MAAGSLRIPFFIILLSRWLGSAWVAAIPSASQVRCSLVLLGYSREPKCTCACCRVYALRRDCTGSRELIFAARALLDRFPGVAAFRWGWLTSGVPLGGSGTADAGPPPPGEGPVSASLPPGVAGWPASPIPSGGWAGLCPDGPDPFSPASGSSPAVSSCREFSNSCPPAIVATAVDDTSSRTRCSSPVAGTAVRTVLADRRIRRPLRYRRTTSRSLRRWIGLLNSGRPGCLSRRTGRTTCCRAGPEAHLHQSR